MTLPPHVTDDGILQNLNRARYGSGEAMAHHYRDFLVSQDWIDAQYRITAKGMAKIARRERAAA